MSGFKLVFAYKEGNSLVLGIKSQIAPKKGVELQIRAVDQERFIIKGYLSHYTLLPEASFNDTLVFRVVLEELLANIKAINKNQLLEFTIREDKKYSVLLASETISNMLNAEIEINELSSIKYRKNVKNSFELWVSTKSISQKADSVKIENGKILIRLKGNQEGKTSLFIKRRAFKNITKYTAEVELIQTKEEYYAIGLDEILMLRADEQTNFDFILRTNSGQITIDDFLKLECNFTKEVVTYGSSQMEFYSTKNGSLAVSVKEVYLDKKVSVRYDTSSGLSLEFEEKIDRIGIFRELQLANGASAATELIMVKSITVGSYHVFLELGKLMNANRSNTDHKYLFIGLDEANNKYRLISSVEEKFDISEPLSISFKSNATGTELINKQNQRSIINLSILGSCFSRSAFNSVDNFFNKDYKGYYNVNYTCFWFSALSSMSNKIKFKKEDYANSPAKIVENDRNLRREYEKTLFHDLSNAKTDYLIIDFFVDAVHGVRKFEKNQYLSRNIDLNSTSHFRNDVLLETEHFNYKNQNYFIEWKNSVDLFLDRVKEIVPHSNIILNLGGMTKQYLDNKNMIKSFVNDKNFDERMIDNHNLMWKRMNNYFRAKCPEAKVVDMSRFDFYGLLEYPGAAPGPHHYESNYYKAFVGEVSKVIMKDKVLAQYK